MQTKENEKKKSVWYDFTSRKKIINILIYSSKILPIYSSKILPIYSSKILPTQNKMFEHKLHVMNYLHANIYISTVNIQYNLNGILVFYYLLISSISSNIETISLRS